MGLLPFRGADSLTDSARDDKGKTTLMSKWIPFSSKHFLLLGIAVVLLLVMACAPDAKQSTFGTSGPVAEKQLLLFNVLLWVMVVVFLLVEGVLLYAVIKFRRRPGNEGLPPQTHGHTALEITWTIIPTVLILALGIWSTLALFELDQPPPGADTLEVTAVGHQWWWEFEYPDADGDGKRITTANELRVPVDRAIQINLRSDDVIHSFWVPKLAGKVDVVPTRENYMWFQADETGIFLRSVRGVLRHCPRPDEVPCPGFAPRGLPGLGRWFWRNPRAFRKGPGGSACLQQHRRLRGLPYRHRFRFT